MPNGVVFSFLFVMTGHGGGFRLPTSVPQVTHSTYLGQLGLLIGVMGQLQGEAGAWGRPPAPHMQGPSTSLHCSCLHQRTLHRTLPAHLPTGCCSVTSSEPSPLGCNAFETLPSPDTVAVTHARTHAHTHAPGIKTSSETKWCITGGGSSM